ncbi:hypothetical protein KGQ72_02645 [Patescibacteria group bacterium]|nr:hypothetical protein [Patescibacteria group bacterium]
MDISLVAKVLGVYLVVGGLFAIFRGKTLPHLLKDFFGHPAVVYLTGVILVFLAALVLLQNKALGSLVTVLVWLVLIKGLAYIFFPEMLEKMVTKKLLDTVSTYGVIAIVAGIYLFYVG